MLEILRRKAANASNFGKSLQRVGPAVSAQRNYTTANNEVLHPGSGSKHVRNFSSHILPGITVGSKPLREVVTFFQKGSLVCTWSRSFSSDSGDLVDAVVPFMGESITDAL